MALSEEQQKEIIPELDDFAIKAQKIAKEIDYLQGKLELYKDEGLCSVAIAASKLVGQIQTANDSLKRARRDWVKRQVTAWHHFRIDDEEERPVYEQVLYKGNDEWQIIMCTPTHGRERVVLHACDGMNWTGVYSAESIKGEANATV